MHEEQLRRELTQLLGRDHADQRMLEESVRQYIKDGIGWARTARAHACTVAEVKAMVL